MIRKLQYMKNLKNSNLKYNQDNQNNNGKKYNILIKQNLWIKRKFILNLEKFIWMIQDSLTDHIK